MVFYLCMIEFLILCTIKNTIKFVVIQVEQKLHILYYPSKLNKSLCFHSILATSFVTVYCNDMG